MRKKHSWWISGSALLCGVLLSFVVSVCRAKDFTIVALPDTQFYSETYPKIAVAQTAWIVAHKEKLNIVYVAHLGDITNQGDDKPEQWPNAADSLYRLENPDTTGLPGGIPYGVVPGNHDHRGGTGQFNKFFGVNHFAGRPYYGGHFGGENNSHFDKFTAGGLEFVVLYIDFDYDKLDYAPIDAWADGVLKTNASRRAIVVSHDLLAVNGTFDPRGSAIYQNLKGNPNLFLMLCGHNHGEASRFDTHDGRTVLTCLSDFQSWAEGGSGYLRLYTFSPDKNLVHVRTYSPWLDKFKTDAGSQFEFSYRMDGEAPAGLGYPPPEPSVVPGEADSTKP